MREPAPEKEADTFVDWLLGRARHWLGLIAVGSLLALIWRRGFLALGTSVVRRPLMNLGSGVLTVGAGAAYPVVLLVLLIILSIILGFIGLGGLIAVAWIAGLLSIGVVALGIVLSGTFVAGALASLVVGRLIMENRIRTARLELWAWLGLGALLYTIVAGLPWVGVLAQIAAALLTLGVFGRSTLNRLRGARGSRTEA